MIEEFRDILFKTREFFEDAGPQNYFTLCRFWVLISLVPAIEFTLIAFLLNIPVNFPYEVSGIFLSIIIFIISFLSLASGGLLFNFIYAGIIHLVARLFGCRNFKKTLTSVIISNLPNLLVGFCLQMLFTLGISFFTPIFADYFIYIITLLAVMAVMWLWSLVINIIGMSTLHEISFIKATVSVFIIPLIIVGSVTAYATRLSISYVKDILLSHINAVSIKSASCINGRIVVDLNNKIDDVVEGRLIEVFIDSVNETQYFNFGDIKPGESRSTMSVKLDSYSTGEHTIEVKYHGRVINTKVVC